MKIDYSPYRLTHKGRSFSREGALLRVRFSDGIVGYADCHPWKELGDLPLNEQLSGLRDGLMTPLTRQSVSFARLDGDARSKNQSLFADVTIPSSHYLLDSLEESIPEGFALAKVKLGKNPKNEIEQLPAFLRALSSHTCVRFDFNNRLDYHTFQTYLESIQPWAERVDFIEDPFPYDPDLWETVQNQSGISLALDSMSEIYYRNLKSHRVSVVKPAVQDWVSICDTDPHEIVLTNYLDHPLGQMSAAYCAAKAFVKHPNKVLSCGLIAHKIYQTNKYSEALQITGDRLAPPAGTGFGFDQLLPREKWKPINNPSNFKKYEN